MSTEPSPHLETEGWASLEEARSQAAAGDLTGAIISYRLLLVDRKFMAAYPAADIWLSLGTLLLTRARSDPAIVGPPLDEIIGLLSRAKTALAQTENVERTRIVNVVNLALAYGLRADRGGNLGHVMSAHLELDGIAEAASRLDEPELLNWIDEARCEIEAVAGRLRNSR